MKALIVTITVLTTLLAISYAAYADEPNFCRFTGEISLSEQGVPDGTVVIAIVDGEEYSTTTPTGYGTSTYSILIQPPAGTLYPDGTEVRFKIGNCPADQTSTIEAGQNIRLDLTAPFSPDCFRSIQSDTSSSTHPLVIVGLVFAFIAEVSLVGSVAYIAVNNWN
jgi:hypothetical protein